MNLFSAGWAAFVLRYRLPVIMFTFVLAGLTPFSFDRLYHDNSAESYFVEHDPHLLSFDRLVDLFGDPEYLLVGIPARGDDADVFVARTLSMIADITDFLEEHRLVTQVRSLSKYQYIHDDDGLLATDDLFDDARAYDPAAETVDRARRIMAGERLALETLLTPDFKHTQIIARIEYRPGENAHKVALVHDLQAFIAARAYGEQGYDIHLSGMPVIGERFEVLTRNDQAWLNPVMGIIMAGILFSIFRSLFATLVPLLVIGTTMLFVTGLQGWLHWPFTAVNAALLPTVLILCIGTCIHVLVEFFQFRRAGKDPREASKKTIEDLLFAVLFTCVTTSVGFIALSVTELRPVRQFAVLAAVAPMVIFWVSMTLLPAILSYVPWLPRQRQMGGDRQNRALPQRQPIDKTVTRWLTERLPAFVGKYRKWIACSGVVITLFSFYGVSFMRVDANIINYFKADSWMNRDLHYFNAQFKGISNLEIIVDSGEMGGVKEPGFLARVDALQAWVHGFDATGKPTSLLDFYKKINQALHNDNPEWHQLPSSRQMAAQLLLLYENTGPEEDLSDLKDFNEQVLRLRVPVINMDETHLTRLVDEIADGVAMNFADLNVDLTGNLVMSNAQNRYVNNGMFQSFGLAILVIGLAFLVLFRSFKYGVIALVPSIVPVLLTGGLVSLAGVAMDLGTMIVGAMTIGIAVDDSIHLMSRYLLMRRRGADAHQAIQYAMNSSGRAVILTSLVLVCGFSVMLFGSFVSYIYVGLFSAMIMFIALIGDILFMPALLLLADGKQVEPEHLQKVTGSNSFVSQV